MSKKDLPKNKVSNLIGIGILIVLTAALLLSSNFISKKQTTDTRAAGIGCPLVTVSPDLSNQTCKFTIDYVPDGSGDRPNPTLVCALINPERDRNIPFNQLIAEQRKKLPSGWDVFNRSTSGQLPLFPVANYQAKLTPVLRAYTLVVYDWTNPACKVETQVSSADVDEFLNSPGGPINTGSTVSTSQDDNQVEEDTEANKKCTKFKCPRSKKIHSVNEKGVYFVNRQCTGRNIRNINNYCALEIAAATPTPTTTTSTQDNNTGTRSRNPTKTPTPTKAPRDCINYGQTCNQECEDTRGTGYSCYKNINDKRPNYTSSDKFCCKAPLPEAATPTPTPEPNCRYYGPSAICQDYDNSNTTQHELYKSKANDCLGSRLEKKCYGSTSANCTDKKWSEFILDKCGIAITPTPAAGTSTPVPTATLPITEEKCTAFNETISFGSCSFPEVAGLRDCSVNTPAFHSSTDAGEECFVYRVCTNSTQVKNCKYDCYDSNRSQFCGGVDDVQANYDFVRIINNSSLKKVMRVLIRKQLSLTPWDPPTLDLSITLESGASEIIDLNAKKFTCGLVSMNSMHVDLFDAETGIQIAKVSDDCNGGIKILIRLK